MGKVQENRDETVTKLESELKQSKFTSDNLKLDLETSDKKFKEAEKFLKVEVLKNKRLNEEVSQLKERFSNAEAKLKSQMSGAEELLSPKTPLTPIQKPIGRHTLLKSSQTSLSKTSSHQDPMTLKRQSTVDVEPVPAAEIVGLKKQLASIEAKLKKAMEEKNKLEEKVKDYETKLVRRDAELFEMKRSIEEKADFISTLQEENKKLLTTSKLYKEKRDLGLKEIQKLRDKLETLKTQTSLNESLNTSFSMNGLNDSINLSSHDRGKVADLLHM